MQQYLYLIFSYLFEVNLPILKAVDTEHNTYDTL